MPCALPREQRPSESWPRPGLEYTEGCAGGEPTTVLIGFLSNLGLLGMFVSFYVRTYYGGGRSRATKAA